MKRPIVACAVVVVLLASSLLIVPPSASLGLSPVSSATVGQDLLELAEASLGHGQGPARGAPLDCASLGGLSAGCADQSPTPSGEKSGLGWSELCGYDSCPIPSRGGVGMTFDPQTGYIVLFGGIMNLTTAANTTYNDTWIFSDGAWQQLHIPGPSARLGEYMAYDYSDHYVLLFGGGPYLTLNSSLYDSDTWAFQNGTWTQLHPTNSPTARGLGGMVWDPVDGYVLMYGGMSGETDIHSDTWIFRDGQWENLSLSHHPPPLLSPGMTYDAAAHYVLVYGGATPSASYEFGDDIEQTWTYTDGAWTNLTGSIHGQLPPGRILGSMAYDPAQKVVILYGGWNTTTSTFFGDTWIFEDGSWDQLYTSPSPAPQIIGATMISTTPSAGVVLFGGVVGTFTNYRSTNATWAFGPPPANTTVYHPPALPDTVSIRVDPSSCPGVQFNGSSQATSGNITVPSGSYNVSAPPCPGYTFDSWFDTGGANVASGTSTSRSTQVSLTSNGTLTAFYEPANSTAYQPKSLEIGVAIGALVFMGVLGIVAYRYGRVRRPPVR